MPKLIHLIGTEKFGEPVFEKLQIYSFSGFRLSDTIRTNCIFTILFKDMKPKVGQTKPS